MKPKQSCYKAHLLSHLTSIMKNMTTKFLIVQTKIKQKEGRKKRKEEVCVGVERLHRLRRICKAKSGNPEVRDEGPRPSRDRGTMHKDIEHKNRYGMFQRQSRTTKIYGLTYLG